MYRIHITLINNWVSVNLLVSQDNQFTLSIMHALAIKLFDLSLPFVSVIERHWSRHNGRLRLIDTCAWTRLRNGVADRRWRHDDVTRRAGTLVVVIIAGVVNTRSSPSYAYPRIPADCLMVSRLPIDTQYSYLPENSLTPCFINPLPYRACFVG